MMFDMKGCLTVLAVAAFGAFALYAIVHTALGWLA